LSRRAGLGSIFEEAHSLLNTTADSIQQEIHFKPASFPLLLIILTSVAIVLVSTVGCMSLSVGLAAQNNEWQQYEDFAVALQALRLTRQGHASASATAAAKVKHLTVGDLNETTSWSLGVFCLCRQQRRATPLDACSRGFARDGFCWLSFASVALLGGIFIRALSANAANSFSQDRFVLQSQAAIQSGLYQQISTQLLLQHALGIGTNGPSPLPTADLTAIMRNAEAAVYWSRQLLTAADTAHPPRLEWTDMLDRAIHRTAALDACGISDILGSSLYQEAAAGTEYTPPGTGLLLAGQVTRSFRGLCKGTVQGIMHTGGSVAGVLWWERATSQLVASLQAGCAVLTDAPNNSTGATLAACDPRAGGPGLLSVANASAAYGWRVLAAADGTTVASLPEEETHSPATRLLTDVLVMQLVLQDTATRSMVAFVGAGCEAQFEDFITSVVSALLIALAVMVVFFEVWWVPLVRTRARKVLAVQLIRSILVSAIMEHAEKIEAR
jgi:hypothetical protein